MTAKTVHEFVFKGRRYSVQCRASEAGPAGTYEFKSYEIIELPDDRPSARKGEMFVASGIAGVDSRGLVKVFVDQTRMLSDDAQRALGREVFLLLAEVEA